MLIDFRKIFKEHLILIVALTVTLLIYSKFFFFGHISWDDPEMVFKNKAVKDFDLKAMFKESFVGNYLPLTMLLHGLGWWLFDNNDGGHHFINILFHLINGIFVFLIAKRFFPNRKLAEITALVFLLHPLQLESVGWISELKNTLSAFFYFAGLLFYLRYTEVGRQTNYLLALLFFVAGCLSKSSVVIFPLTLIGIDLFLKKGFKISYLLNKIPFFIGAIIFGLINLKTQAEDQFINYSHAFPYHERTGYAGYAIFKYLNLFLIPHKLSVLYPYPSNKLPTLVFGFIFLLFLGLLTYVLYRSKKFPLIGLIFLCISSLILVLQFVPFGEVLYADRYMYIPIVFFTMLVLFLLQNLKINFNYLTYFLLAALSLVTFFRMDVWKDSVHLYTDILKKFPDSFVALNSLGAELMMQNEDEEALKYLNRSVKVSPKNYKGFYNRGLLFLKTRKPKEAIESFSRAIALHDYHKAYIGRASAYYMIQDLPQAMNDARYALQKDPGNPKAMFVMANCYNNLNQLDSAITTYDRSIQIMGDEPDFYFKRGIALGKKQAFPESLRDLDRCVQLNPLYFEAYYWRGVVKVNLNQNPCEDFRIAARNNIEFAVQAYSKYCKGN